jgi:hypothetical protein
MITPTGVDGGHDDRQPKFFKLPLFKGGGSMTGRGLIYDHTFKGYVDTETICGSSQRAIRPWLNPDFTPFTEIFRPKFIDQSVEAITHMGDPPAGWANPQDCVAFPCTGPNNVVMRMEGARFTASRRLSEDGRRRLAALPSIGVMIPTNKMSISSQVVPADCSLYDDWNAYFCTEDMIGTLIFDSLDSDRMDRSV